MIGNKKREEVMFLLLTAVVWVEKRMKESKLSKKEVSVDFCCRFYWSDLVLQLVLLMPLKIMFV